MLKSLRRNDGAHVAHQPLSHSMNVGATSSTPLVLCLQQHLLGQCFQANRSSITLLLGIEPKGGTSNGQRTGSCLMKAAVNLSRRGFFKKLAGLGLGTGLGLAGVGAAQACDPCTTTNCGYCRYAYQERNCGSKPNCTCRNIYENPCGHGPICVPHCFC